MLTLFLLLPLVGAALLAVIPNERKEEARWIALGFSGLALAVSVAIFTRFMLVLYSDAGVEGYEFVDRFVWISPRDTGFTVQYVLGVDGLSAPLVLLTGLLSLASVLVSWRIDLRVSEYFMWLLVLESAVAGVFMSLDLIQFFFFWELELIPMYLLISIWGSGRKE